MKTTKKFREANLTSVDLTGADLTGDSLNDVYLDWYNLVLIEKCEADLSTIINKKEQARMFFDHSISDYDLTIEAIEQIDFKEHLLSLIDLINGGYEELVKLVPESEISDSGFWNGSDDECWVMTADMEDLESWFESEKNYSIENFKERIAEDEEE